MVAGGGLLIGWLTAQGEWYAHLQKPAFKPPNWIFAPVWTVLYVLIAIAGWRVWQREARALPMTLWWVQLALNFLWSPTFLAATASASRSRSRSCFCFSPSSSPLSPRRGGSIA